MLFGVTPFKGKDRNATFNSVLHTEVQFPDHPGAQQVTSICKSLIRKLLIKDDQLRLGSKAGASDVKQHPFFKTTNWALLRHLTPPIIPQQSFGDDAINFRQMHESVSLDIEHEELVVQQAGSKNPFADFTSGKSSPQGWMNCMISRHFFFFVELRLTSETLGGMISIIVTLHHDGDDYS